ncbi:MAG TPA: RHS repeat-associated core domain-containing protein [Streptosporangiaceae bacterium]|nr:RHS repeat-associated core domain-containing protein [Streptosporangiaceae bacterium]
MPDTTDPTEDTCTQTSYATNTKAGLLDLPAEVIVTAVPPSACPVSGAPTQAELVSDTTTYYDGSTTLGAPPTAGDATMTQKATSFSGNPPAEVFTTETKDLYDSYGRVTSATDADNHTTLTSYTPATGAEPTSQTVTDPMGLATTTTYDPARDLPLTVTSPAGFETEKTYDALGRITAGWNQRIPSDYNPQSMPLANKTFSYDLSNTKTSVVTTGTLNTNGTYLYSDTFYDSLGRQIETQQQTTDGKGMTVTDTNYNSDGWPAVDNNPYFVQFNPNSAPPIEFGTLVDAPAGQVPSSAGYVYDGAGRVTRKILYSDATEKWETDTAYGGDYATVTPPTGGTATTTYTNGFGLTSYIYTYHSSPPPATPPPPGTAGQSGPSGWDVTSYTYTAARQLATITDTDKNKWSYGYDLAGDQTTATDPDTGTTTSNYDAAGNLMKVTSPTSDQVSYTYDADNRKTFEYNTTGGAPKTPAHELAAWTWDTLAKGLLTSATSYGPGGTSGTSYTEAVTSYNADWGLPADTRVQISAGPLAGTYEQDYAYDLNTQLPITSMDSAAGPLPQEGVNTGYDPANRPAELSGLFQGAGSFYYVSNLSYTELGQPYDYTLGGGTDSLDVINTYDPETGLPQTTGVQTTPGQTLDATTYTYDHAGLLTSEANTQASASGTPQVQCFAPDYLGRTVTAWSQASTDCTNGPSRSAEAGAAAPYWENYTYNDVNDLTQVTSTPPTPTGSVTTTINTFPAPGSSQPHGVATQQVSGQTGKTQYSYNAAGQTTLISAPGQTQNLNWDDTGKLASAATTGGSNPGTTSYAYDADGNLLLQQDPGSATLYLFGGSEQLTQDTATKTVTGTRYYSLGGVTVAARTANSTSDNVSFLAGDTQGTMTLAVDATTLAPTYRYFDPYGNPVTPASGPPAAWPAGNHGFVGGTADAVTGFTNLGAREYNPTTASFLSPDPLITPDNPQTLNAYAYAADDPTTNSDPSGASVTCGAACRPAPPPPPGHHNGSGNGNNSTGSGDPGWYANTGYSMDNLYWMGFLNTVAPPPPVHIITRTTRAMIAHQASAGMTCIAGNPGAGPGAGPQDCQPTPSVPWQQVAATSPAANFVTGVAISKILGAVLGSLGGVLGRSLGGATDAGAGADNVANTARLAQQLTREEASSVFTQSGELQPDVIAQSHEIINGAQLGNKQLVSELTSNGSDIADWGKYTTPTFISPAGAFQVHFYYNPALDEVFYGQDYKAVFVGGSP